MWNIIIIPFIGTTMGAASVFLLKKENGKNHVIFKNKITRFKQEKSTGLGLKIAQDMACLVGAKLIQKKQNNRILFSE